MATLQKKKQTARIIKMSKVNPDFKKIFFRERSSFAFQNPGQDWKTSKKPLGDGIIQSHLSHKLWVGTKAGWYTELGCLDIDVPDIQILKDVMNYFGFDESNSLIERSPNKGFHVFFKPRFNEKVPTKKLFFDCLTKYEKLLQQALNLPQLEIFPRNNRALRGPLGKDQIFMSHDDHSPLILNQEKLLYWWEKLDSVDLKDLSIQRHLSLQFSQSKESKEVVYNEKASGEYLYLFGPQPGISRYDTTWRIILYLFRLNFNYDEIYGKIYQYILKHQNWFMRSSKHGGHTFQRAAAQIGYLRRNEAKYTSYPDSINNTEFNFTKQDLAWILKNFPRKNEQRSVFKLIRYYKPRARRVGPWVRIHKDKWREWMSSHNVKRFQRMLESKNILESRKDYIVGSYARHYKIDIPIMQGEILHDGRQLRNFEASLNEAFSKQDLYQLIRKDVTAIKRITEKAAEQIVILDPEKEATC